MRKKLVSLLLATAMAVSVMSPFTGTAFAEEAAGQTIETEVTTEQATDENAGTDNGAADENDTDEDITDETPAEESEAVQQVVALFEALPKAEAVSGMSAQEREEVSNRLVEALNAFDQLSAEDGALFLENHEKLYQSVTEDLMMALLSAPEDTPTDLSLRPMEETTGVYLTLSGYTKDELKNFSLDQMLTMLTDNIGNPIAVDSSYTHAWVYFSADEIDEYYTVGTGATIDLWNYAYSGDTVPDTSYNMWLVLSQGDQMEDGQNHRYIITVELSGDLESSYYFTINPYTSTGSSLNCLTSRADAAIFKELGMEGRAYTFTSQDYQEGATYQIRTSYSGMVNELLRDGIKLEVYPMGTFLDFRDNGTQLTGDIADEIFETGYTGPFDQEVTSSNYKTAPNLLCFVFRDKDSDRILGYFGASFVLKKGQNSLNGRLWSNLSGNKTQVAFDEAYSAGAYFGGRIDTSATGDGVGLSYNSYGSFSFQLPDEYSADDIYYFTLDSTSGVKQVYSGLFDSEADAQRAGATNLTSQVLYMQDGNVPQGFELNPSMSRALTLVMSDGSTVGVTVYSYKPSSTTSYGNEIDPDFQISGVSLPGKYLDTYVARAVSGVQLDTYYRNDERYEVGGYQLILIKDKLTDAEMQQLIPRFNTPAGVVVSSGSRVESGKTDLSHAVWSDSLDDTVMYQVQVPGKKLKNYQVTFATLQDQGSLYVAGPDERFVNLTADNKYVHDILVANIGETDLTDVKVELLGAVNIKLDDYWTLNGDTIPAFTTTGTYYTEKDESGQTTGTVYNAYANPNNVAKVRLVADGEGEIKGTLRITAGNGQVREIKLTGIAANPHIIDGDLDDAVKYVPYSYMVVTDNMYNWNRLSFQVIDGKLPDGVNLYEATGEIYGTPKETGDFTFTVQVDYGSPRFTPSTATYTLHVADNSNQMVYNQTDAGYEIQTHLGVEQGEGTRDFLLTDISHDQLYVSEGVYPEFMGLWLNGEKLIPGRDYTSESGSTRITIKSQTFVNKAYKDDVNTIAAEFRVDGNRNNELKRTAQNFRIGELQTVTSDTNTSSGSSNNDSEETETSVSSTQDQDAAAQAAALAAKGVTLRFYIVDEQNNPMAGVSVELHSTPRYGTTNANGSVVFRNVEFGPHTLTVYGKDGSVLGSKSFELVPGSFSTSGDVITVMGGSTLSIRVKAAGNALSFTSVNAAATGDLVNTRWLVVLLAAMVCIFVGITVYRRKQNQKVTSQQS